MDATTLLNVKGTIKRNTQISDKVSSHSIWVNFAGRDRLLKAEMKVKCVFLFSFFTPEPQSEVTDCKVFPRIWAIVHQ